MTEAVGALVVALLSIPPVRLFLEDVFVRVFVELVSRQDSDPTFSKQFTALTYELAQAKTEDEKRAILLKIRDLRKSAA